MEQMLQDLINYAGDDYEPEQDAFLMRLISDATDEVMSEMFPYGFSSLSEEDIARERALKRYRSKIRKIAEYHYDKQGKEGVTSWSEGGVSASYDSSGTPSSYLRGIIPVAKIV